MLSSKDFSGILTRGGTILGTSRQPFKLMRVPDEKGLDKVEAMKQTYYKLCLDCLVILGGGGHTRAAGCDLHGSMYDVINNITAEIERQLAEEEDA